MEGSVRCLRLLYPHQASSLLAAYCPRGACGSGDNSRESVGLPAPTWRAPHHSLSIHSFSTKTILIDQQNEVPTKGGLTVTMDVGMLFHIDPTKACDIYVKLGKNYDELVVEPELAFAVRGMTSE
eukprot:3913188-Rhodomonas_salina.1